MDNVTKPFVVVKFIEDNKDDEIVSEIPSNWLDGEGYCWWPKTKRDKSYMIAKRVPPNASGKWERCQIEIKHHCSTYEKARKVAENDMSESSESESKKGRGQRKKIPKCPIDMSDTSTDEIYAFDFPEFPQNNDSDGDLQEHASIGQQSLVETPVVEELSPEVPVVEFLSSTNSPNLNDMLHSNTSDALNKLKEHMDNYMSKVFKMLGNIQLMLNDMKISSNSSFPDHMDLEEVRSQLPLLDLDALRSFERFIENKDKRSKVITYYKTIGGGNLKEKIVRILKRTLTNELAAQTSWLGQRNNFKMCSLGLTSTIKDVIIHSPDFDEKLFEEVFSDWLRQAKQRFKRESRNVGS